jgi:hypothetical protein
MKKDNGKKLSIKTETVRVLNKPELEGVAGGIMTTAMTCTEPSHVTGVCHGHHTRHCKATTYVTC